MGKFGFAHMLDLDTLPNDGVSLTFEAGEAERTALAERFELVSIERLEGVAKVYKKRDILHIEASISSDVTQACIITLEPVPAAVSDTFHLELVKPEEAARRDMDEAYLADDMPEYDELEPGPLHIGEILAQTLSMAIDPNPRADGATLEAAVSDVGAAKQGKPGLETNAAPLEKKNPFAALEALRGGDND